MMKSEPGVFEGNHFRCAFSTAMIWAKESTQTSSTVHASLCMTRSPLRSLPVRITARWCIKRTKSSIKIDDRAHALLILRHHLSRLPARKVCLQVRWIRHVQRHCCLVDSRGCITLTKIGGCGGFHHGLKIPKWWSWRSPT